MALIVVTGSPGCGKSTWMRNTAKPGDIQIGSDELTNALTGQQESKHHHAATAKKVSKAAREAAIQEAIKQSDLVDVWILISNLTEDKASMWRVYGAQFVVIDPGYDLALQRCKENRPGYKHRLVDSWYSRRDEWPRGARVVDPGIIVEAGKRSGEEPRPKRTSKAKRGTTERGYGYDHQKARENLIFSHVDGTLCDWCGQPMYVEPAKNFDGEPLHADHTKASEKAAGGQADRLLHGLCNKRKGRSDEEHGPGWYALHEVDDADLDWPGGQAIDLEKCLT